MAMQVCHIWLGLFAADAPTDYFAEQYTDDDGRPINRFAEEQGEIFYDHDWVEISYLAASETANLRSLIDGHSYSVSYLDAVCDQAKPLGIEAINVVVIADQEEFTRPRSVAGESYWLRYLGEFACKT